MNALPTEELRETGRATNEVPDRITELENRLAEKEKRELYLLAEIENIKKRSAREREQAVRYALEGIAMDLVDVVDSLERALENAAANGSPQMLEGIALTLRQLKSTLEKHGIRRLPAEHEAFDPNFHEAVDAVSSEYPKDTIVSEEAPGYTLHDRLLRPARVVVSRGPANT